MPVDIIDESYTQEERLLRIEPVKKDSQLLLEKFAGTETLSTPFEFKLTLLSPDFSVDLKGYLRTAATVTVFLSDGTPRFFNGVIRSFAQVREGEDVLTEREQQMAVSHPARDLAVYEAILVPQVWFLSLDADCRIFQNMSVPEIVEQVLTDHDVKKFQFRLNGTYPKRDYCVQYRESSLNFVSRLLEEEGIFYFFEHDDMFHTMVFADKSPLLPACQLQPVAEYSFDQKGWIGEGEEGVASLERIETAHTGKVELTDYNFETPSLSLRANLPGQNEELFDYPGEYGTKTEGERYARLRLEERESGQFVVNGASICRAFQPGCYFKLKGHYRTDTNQDYFLTSVTHEALDSTYRQDRDESHFYVNSFQAIPKAVVFRPPSVTERPVVRGMQPALVVGKAGEEIWVDKYGRVKVQFYWDRLGKKNENSSCWCRVSQVWAGKNWGWMTIPRIGQEVLVDFLEGDPDQPVIVGRVYNAEQMPPYALPANQTQSGFKSRSSKGAGGDNFNEIRFEDLKGQEMMTIHAEKDMSSHVEHDDTQKVENNRTINVDGTHTETIIKDTKITITQGNHDTNVQKGNQSIKVDMGNQSTELGMGNQSTELKLGNQTNKITLGKIDTSAMQSITLTVGGSSIKIDQIGVTIEGMIIKINGKIMTDVQGGVMLTLKGGITMIN